MPSNEDQELIEAINKVNKSFKVFRLISIIVLIVFVVLWLSFVAVVGSSALSNSPYSESIPSLFYMILVGVLVISFLVVVIRFFSDVVNGESPFTHKQSKRFRQISIILLIFVAAEAILSFGFRESTDFMGLAVGVAGVYSATGAPVVSINIGALVMSAFFYSLSKAFTYGVLLQRLTDETV